LRDRELKPRTRELYRALLDQKILPTLTDLPLKSITTVTVRDWYRSMGTDHPTRRSHSYALLRTILNSAVGDDLITSNPCRIRAAGTSKRVRKIEIAELDELDRIVAALPDRYRVMVLLASWCGLRWGEVTELRRGDIDLKKGKIQVSRGVTWVKGKPVVGMPKSSAGVRTVSVPPHVLPAIQKHLADHVLWGTDALLFPAEKTGQQIANGSFFKTWDRARKAAGKPSLRFHDLRHTGGTLTSMAGATLADSMARLGHTTPRLALLYQHVAADRDSEIARRLSAIAEGTP
jgi:integrase